MLFKLIEFVINRKGIMRISISG